MRFLTILFKMHLFEPREEALSLWCGAVLGLMAGGWLGAILGVLSMVLLFAGCNYVIRATSHAMLVDADARNEDCPDTFDLPSIRDRLSPGDHAKLVFRPGERLWVLVEKVYSDPVAYEGTLLDEPAVVRLKVGQHVRFEPRHVVDVRWVMRGEVRR